MIEDLSTDNEIKIAVNKARVDIITAKKIKELVKDLYEDSPRDIHFDFSSVAFVSSSGIGTLLYTKLLLKNSNNNRIYLDGLNKELKDLFTQMGLDNFIIIK